ncbi:hypothetical protein C923_05919 [Plasmodium falciparum UGT5.1]|uniref:Uncharacterized protein n=1 Tax=Plasmodium falciparum UGT5.1 TaxID=1237627 RepID=W7JP59_PLAFA|nr:hypothetical protein C923_05919 [Plasmodium falciparum UGT5.1]
MTLPIGMSLVSCINNEGNENLKNKIPKDLDYVPNIENPLEQKTNKLIENLININFKQDNVEKVNFLNSQKDEETLLNKAKELSQVKHSAEFFRQLDKQDKPDDLIFFDNN